MDNAITLSKLVPTETDLSKRLIWAQFKGVKFQIRYVSRSTLMAIADQCMTVSWDTKAKKQGRQLDPDRFVKEVSRTIVKNWVGLTLKTLSELMPLNLSEGTSEEDLSKEVPFTEENLLVVVQNVHELDGFLQECAVDASLFRSEGKEALQKNSLSSPIGA